MGRYNLDKERLKRLERLKNEARSGKGRMSARQVQELSIMKAQEEAAVLDIPQEKLEKIAEYLRGQAKLERATKSDLARLMIIEERLSIIKTL